jgi:hypothetical protein
LGEQLGRAERSVMWWIGDWWAYGEHRYGDRAAIVQAPDWTGPSYQTCREAARVARQFPAPKRQVDLTFGHHQEVAALPHDQAEALLERAASEGLSSRVQRCPYCLPRAKTSPSRRVCWEQCWDQEVRPRTYSIFFK